MDPVLGVATGVKEVYHSMWAVRIGKTQNPVRVGNSVFVGSILVGSIFVDSARETGYIKKKKSEFSHFFIFIFFSRITAMIGLSKHILINPDNHP